MADEIRLDVSANTTPMERDIADARRRVGTITLNASMDSRGMENFNRSLGKITGQADEFSKSMEAANARVLAFGASVGVINAISNAFKGLVSSTIEVEKSLTEIKIIGDETFSNLNKTSAGLFATAKQLGVSYKDAADATLEFARQGKGLSDSLNASKAALALTRTAGISATEAVMGLTSAVNAFGRGAEAYIEYANKMSSVSDAFAVNNKDLIEGMSRSASVAQEAGVSFEELTALITTLQEKTGRGGAVIGNALKTIFTRVKNPEIIKDLEDLGVTIQDNVTGNFLPATKILQNLANEFQNFDKNIRNNILLKVGGGFQVDKLAALLNDIKDSSGTFQRSFQIAGSGNGDILGRVAKLNQTIDSSFTNILTSSKQLGANIGQIAFSKDFTNILQNGASLISSLNDAIFGNAGDAEDQGSAIGKAVLKGLGSVISGPGLFALFGIFAKLSIDFAKFSTEGVKTLIGITSKTKEEQLIQTAITNVLSRNADFQKQIFSLEGNRVAQAELLLGVIRQQVNESKKLQEITGGISPILRERGVRLSGSSPQIVGSAKGYVPNLADAIAKEKSESPAGSKIIVDRNFPMGGGQRSTMVYNSNETRIKNFAGTGGDAIIPNYPINSAKGFVPNFAKKQKKAVQDDGRKSLEVDATNLSVAGLTFAGENKGSIKRAKPVPIDEDLLAKYSGSPYVKVLEQFKNFTLTNVPVGNVYRLRKGLQQSEEEIKADFVQRLNSKFREQTVSFLLEEISGLGLPTGGGVGKNLSNLKLNVIGSSTAGYIFEELLKIPTLSDAEKVAQYASQSDTDYFDIKNLSPEFSEAYGLPKRAYDLVELKFGERELKDGISKKFLNQLVAEGGGANPKKFGQKDTNRAASGYIPNFSDETFDVKKTMSQLGEIQSKNNADSFDIFKGRVKLIRQAKSNSDYNIQAQKIVKNIYPKTGFLNERMLGFYKKYFSDQGASSTYLQTWESTLKNKDNPFPQFISSTKGMLGELDASKLINKKLISGNSPFDFPNYIDARTRKQDSAQNILKKGVNFLLRNKNYAQGNEDTVNLPEMTAIIASDTTFANAAKGYIPNFSELTGTGAGMMYQDPNFKELGGGQSGKFLAPKSGEGFGQKIFYKLGSDKINQELQVNKSIKDFEKQNPTLFAKNAISFTNVGKLLTKNGLAAGFEREVIGGLGVDDFATEAFAKPGQTNPKAGFAFYLSELLAQAGVKNVVGEYRKIYGPDSLRIDDIYAQNFKVNDIMQKLLIDETNKFFKGKKNVKDSDVDNYIRSLNGNPLVNSLNEKFGSAGGRHTMFDTQGFAKNASKGYVPNFAKLTADILTVNPAVAKLSVDQFIEKYLGSEYSTGLSGTSANAVKISGNPQQMAEAKRDFIMSMLGPNFLATYERDEKANRSRASLISQKSKSTGTRVKRQGGFMQAYGDYAQTDLSAALEGTFSGEAKRLNYEDLDTKAEKIFQQNNLTQYWNEIVKTMQLVGEAYRGEMISASNMGVKPNFDYNTIEVPEEGKFQYGMQVKYKAKDKIKQLTALIRPKLIEGLLEGEKGVQGLVLNQPEYDKESSVQGDYFILLDKKAAQLKKLVSDYLINPNLDPLQIGSREQSENKFRIKEIIDVLDGTFGSEVARKGILLDKLKQFRKYSEGNPQLQKFFMDGEDRPGAFIVNKTLNQKTRETSNKLGAFLKPGFPQSTIERMATVLAAAYNRDGIFPLSNLDVGYTGALSYEGAKNNPLIDTFATSPQSPSSIPSTIKYGDYKNNKAYYDSIAKWKYDANSKSMIRQAAKGYIPNFAQDALEDAVVREQLQSGLPSSQISLTRDSRLANNLNPSGFAVINKRDEPNGKVPTNRIANAYKNAGRGFIPNFSERAEIVLNRAAELGGKNTEEAKKAIQENVSSSKASSETQKQVNEKLKSFAKVLEEQIKDFYKSKESIRNLNDAIKQNREALKNYSNLKEEEQKQLRDKILQDAKLNSGSKLDQVFSRAEEAYGKKKPESDQKPPNPEKSTKSFAELASKLFVFQSALSFVSGAMSGLGTTAEKIGESFNDLGQSVIAFSQVGSLADQVKGEKKQGETGFFASGGGFRSGAATLIGVAGAVYGAVQAISAIDKAVLAMNGTFTKSKNFIDDLEISFSKYNIQLSEQSKRISENISKKANVSGAGIGGFFNSIGLNYESIFGDKDIASLQSSLGKTGLSDSANQDLVKKASELIAPQIAIKYANENNGLQIGSKQLQDETQKFLADQFKKIQDVSMKKSDSNNIVESLQSELKIESKKGTNADMKRIFELQEKINKAKLEGESFTLDEQEYLKNITEYLESQVRKTQDATIAEQERKEALLFSSDLLKQQLTSIQQISKIQGSIPSFVENQLSIEKELLTTTEARRMEIDRSIKSLSEQRQLTSEIKDVALTFGRERIDKYLTQIAGTLDVRGDIAEKINKSFAALAGAKTSGEAEGLIGNVLNDLKLKEGDKVDDQTKKQNENLLRILEQQLNVVKANSKAREFQNLMEAQNLAYVKQQNYEYNVRKEAINTQLTLEQRSLDIAKEKLSLTRRREDVQFETSLIGTTSPLQAEKARILQDIKNLQTRPKEDIKTEEANFAQARKQAIANLLNEKNVRPETVQSILNQSGDQQIKSITAELNKERDGFAQQVKDSGEAFYLKIFDAAELLSDAISKSTNAPEKNIADRLDSIGDLSRIPTSLLEKFKEKLEKDSTQQYPRQSYPQVGDGDSFFEIFNMEKMALQNKSLEKNADLQEKINKILEERKKNEYASGTYTDKDTIAKLDAIGPKPVLSKELSQVNDAELKKKLAELEQYNKRFTFKGGMQEAQFQLTDEITTFENKLGKEIPMGFRDSMVSAMRELSNPNSTQPLKERLLGVANAFLQKINEAFMTQAANKLTSGIMGVIPGMASGGIIRGGSGSKDDVPAMLMGGEYVVKKDAVQKYGPSFFDALNKGSIKKFASGGWVESDVTKYQDPTSVIPYGQRRDQGLSFNESGQVIGMDNYKGIEQNKQDAMMRAQSDYYARNAQSGEGGFYMPGQNGMGSIMGTKNLLSFATQQNTGDKFDKIYSSGGMSGIDLGAGSSNMSLFALRDENNSRNKEYLESKQKSLDLYFGSIDAAKDKANQEEENRKEQERLLQEYERQKEEIKKQRKAQMKGILINLGMSVGMAGLGALGKAAMTGGSNALKAANVNAMNSGGSQLSGFDKFKTFVGGMWSGGSLNGTNAGGLSNAFSSSGYQSFQGFSQGSQNYLFKGNTPLGGSRYGWEQQYNKSGGFWNSNSVYMRRAAGGYVAGNGMGDNVPAMLNGGEFVISKQAAQNIGTNKLQQINSGVTSDSSEMIAAKLDELVEKLSAVGTLNITVNSDSKGNEKTTERGGNQDKEAKELARKIKEVVMLVLKDEKRLGGMLR